MNLLSWINKWESLRSSMDLIEACVELADQLTREHRAQGKLERDLVSGVIREVMLMLMRVPDSAQPKPRPPKQDIWGLAATEFLFDVIEWCQASGQKPDRQPTALGGEVSVSVGDYLLTNPRASQREVAAALGCSPSTVGRTPAWRAVAQRRRELSAGSAPRAASFDESAHVADRQSVLDELIAQQQLDDASTHVYASERL